MLREEFRKAYENLTEATKAKEEYEVEYTLEEARKIVSAEISAFSNQKERDAQLRLQMEQNGMYRKLAGLRADSKIAYYTWATLKSLLENGGE